MLALSSVRMLTSIPFCIVCCQMRSLMRFRAKPHDDPTARCGARGLRDRIRRRKVRKVGRSPVVPILWALWSGRRRTRDPVVVTHTDLLDELHRQRVTRAE